MSKAVLISIQPKWCELIASGEKTIEVRKSRPKLKTPFKVYIYCTQEKRLLRKFNKGERIDDEHFFNEHVFVRQNTWIRGHFNPNGKVIGEFVCNEILATRFFDDTQGHGRNHVITRRLCVDSCLSFAEIEAYFGDKDGYFWCISDLVIYDQPKKLQEFNLGRPPQSWCYAEGV